MSQLTTVPGAPAFLDTSRLALVYPRQSSERQVENNIYSLERQLQLRDRAIADGFAADRVVVIDDDLGKSAQTIAKRVGMTRALALVDQGLVGALYAEDQTRLSRDVDTVGHMEIAARCRLARVPIFYGGSWHDLTDRGTRLTYKLEAVIGSEMWGGHLEKMFANRRMKAERGQVASRAVRWGYRLNRTVPRSHPDRDKLIVEEPEADIIRALVARLPEAGSVRELYRATHPTYWPDGAKLTMRTLRNLLASPIYRGTYVWGDVVVPDAHEAIIAATEAAAIDQLIGQNRAIARRPVADNEAGVLCGLTWCSTCDRKMYASRANRRSDYRCQERRNEASRAGFHYSIQGTALDDLVIADLMGRLVPLIGDIIRAGEREQDVRRNTLDLGDASRRAIERQIDGLTRALGDPTATEPARRVILVQLDRAAREMEVLTDRRPERQHADAELAGYRALRDDPDFIAALPLLWTDQPLAWRRTFVRRFFDRVLVEQLGSGRFAVVVRYRDGSEVALPLVTKPATTPQSWYWRGSSGKTRHGLRAVGTPGWVRSWRRPATPAPRPG